MQYVPTLQRSASEQGINEGVVLGKKEGFALGKEEKTKFLRR